MKVQRRKLTRVELGDAATLAGSTVSGESAPVVRMCAVVGLLVLLGLLGLSKLTARWGGVEGGAVA